MTRCHRCISYLVLAYGLLTVRFWWIYSYSDLANEISEYMISISFDETEERKKNLRKETTQLEQANRTTSQSTNEPPKYERSNDQSTEQAEVVQENKQGKDEVKYLLREQSSEEEKNKSKESQRQNTQTKTELPPPPSLHLLGERHSGTNWMASHLKACFGDRIRFGEYYSNWKHWFQYADKARKPNAVVVALFRNVFDWTEAMRFYPHHAPNHFNLGWKEFVEKPWTMPRYGPDTVFENSTIQSHPNPPCKVNGHLRAHQIIPCLANDTWVVNWFNNPEAEIQAYYELRNDGSGLPYKSILELRNAKIRNFVSVANFDGVKHFYVVRYEDFKKNNNGTTEGLLRNLEHALGVPANCTPITIHSRDETKRVLAQDFVDYLIAHVDWEAEARIGYSRNYIPG